MFDLEQFTADCRAALKADSSHKLVREVAARAVADPSGILKTLGEPKRPGIQSLHHAPDLTIINVIWGPMMTVMPHNHHMWAVIGMYGGREDNIFWRRLPADARWPIEAAGCAALMPGDVCPLGKDIIHSVTNPLGRLTSAIHIYGGDFVTQAREQWEEETLRMRPYDPADARRRFEENNERMGLAPAA